MKLEFKNLGPWIFGAEQLKRFTQDSPVMPDVWLQYGREPNAAIDLLLEPHEDSTTGELAKAVLEADHSPKATEPIELAYNGSHVAARLTFEQMLRSVLVVILKLPHHGSIRNMRPAFFERVTADHCVISANGSDGNPDLDTFKLLEAARADDDFEIHLTNREGEEKLREKLDTFLATKQAGNRTYGVSFRDEDALSLRIDLLDEA